MNLNESLLIFITAIIIP